MKVSWARERRVLFARQLFNLFFYFTSFFLHISLDDRERLDLRVWEPKISRKNERAPRALVQKKKDNTSLEDQTRKDCD